MIDIKRKLKNFGPLEFLVLGSLFYVVTMLIWTASTRASVQQKANDIKSNHKMIIEFVNDEIESLQMKVAKKLGYELVDHRMELFGKKIPK